VVTSYLPGQEEGNTEFVVQAGAGSHAPRPRDLAAEIARLREDPAALASMRAASARAGRPRAAADVASLLAEAAWGAEAAGMTRTDRHQSALTEPDLVTADVTG
jgi:UDP-N-acetylglucosamine:LPS N-acetylglucosamine transferase